MSDAENPIEVVNEQAEDEALWCDAVHITEVMLQEALRRLHAAVEGQKFDGYKGKYCE